MINLVQELERRRFRRLSVAGVLLVGWLMRLGLILRGGLFYNPDEYRYYRSIDFLHALTQGAWTEALQVLYTYPQHNGAVLLGAIPAAAQGLLDKLGWPPGQTMWVAAAIFAVVPLINAYLAYCIMRRLGRSQASAFLVLVAMTFSCTMIFYSRHLLPYYGSLMLALFVIWWMLGRKDGAWRLVIAGAAAFGVFLLYNGFWYLSGALLGMLVLVQTPDQPSALARLLRLGLGYVLGFGLVYVVGRMIDADYIRGLTYFSQTIDQGDYADGWWIGWVHLWHAEGVLLGLFGVLAWFSLKEKMAARIPLGCVLLFYIILVCGSMGIEKFVVYGRSMIPVYTAIILAGVIGASRLWREHPQIYTILLVVVLAQSAERYSGVFRQAFPEKILEQVQVSYPDLRLAYSVTGPQPHVDPEFLDPARYVLVNYRVLTPIHGLAELPTGEELLSRSHPAQNPLYLYNGYSREERAWLQSADVRIRLIDTGSTSE